MNLTNSDKINENREGGENQEGLLRGQGKNIWLGLVAQLTGAP